MSMENKYWNPTSKGIMGGNATTAQGTNLQNSTPPVELPKVGDKMLLQVYPHGMVSVFDAENNTASPQATYIEVEVKSLKKAKVSFEE